jgi:hypothetical protein
MAKSRKKNPSPTIEVNAPQALVPIMQAFHAESEEVVEALVIEASKAIAPRELVMGRTEPSEAEIEMVASLMRSLNPQDSIETLCAAQIVISHLLGLRKLGSDYEADESIGLRMLRFSNEAMQLLTKKRGGGTQNITVNYNYNGTGNAMSQPSSMRSDHAS